MKCDKNMLSLWSHRSATWREQMAEQFVVRPLMYSKFVTGYHYEP